MDKQAQIIISIGGAGAGAPDLTLMEFYCNNSR